MLFDFDFFSIDTYTMELISEYEQQSDNSVQMCSVESCCQKELPAGFLANTVMNDYLRHCTGCMVGFIPQQ